MTNSPVPAFHNDPAPVTTAKLFEENAAPNPMPIVAEILYTFAPLLMTRLLPAPLLPTVSPPLLVQIEPGPDTSTELARPGAAWFPVPVPITPEALSTAPPLVMISWSPEPALPIVRLLMLV